MNYKIVIDPGHGGDDPGSSGNGIVEKDLNLKISEYMYDRLRSLGVPVTLTRNTDETLSPTERVNRILNAYGDNPNVIVVSNHINAGGGDGAEVIYALRNNSTLANSILNNIKSEGQNVRDAFQRRLPSNTSKDYYFIHRNTGRTQPVIVEYGFLDSTGDDVAQLKNNYEDYAEAVVRALVDYINVDYEPIGGNYYTVKSGDSLWSIAKKYGVSVNELKEVNNLSSNALSIGQLLKIPEEVSSIPNGNYVVKSGDTLYSIARANNISVNELKEANNLTGNSLSIGQILTIPSSVEEESQNYFNYTVQNGDSLYSIARKYNTTVDEIRDLNNLSSSLLSIGQTLKIPSVGDDETEVEYIVKRGDNLYSIARSYGLTQTELMDYNNLTSNLLSIGQVLRIPLSDIDSENKYVVQSGDTLYSIALKFNTTVDTIRNKNNLASNNLSVGQILTI